MSVSKALTDKYSQAYSIIRMKQSLTTNSKGGEPVPCVSEEIEEKQFETPTLSVSKMSTTQRKRPNNTIFTDR